MGRQSVLSSDWQMSVKLYVPVYRSSRDSPEAGGQTWGQTEAGMYQYEPYEIQFHNCTLQTIAKLCCWEGQGSCTPPKLGLTGWEVALVKRSLIVRKTNEPVLCHAAKSAVTVNRSTVT